MCVGENEMKEEKKSILLFPLKQQLGEKSVWEVPRKPDGASQLSSKFHTLQNVFTFLMHVASHIYLCGSCYFHFLVQEDDSARLVRLVSSHTVCVPFESPAEDGDSLCGSLENVIW